MKNPLDRVHPSWKPLLSYLNHEPLLSLNTEILPNTTFYPAKENIFRVFETPLNQIKTVILGQEPYHGAGQANGLAFSVNENISVPPSLQIIYKQLAQENNWAIKGDFIKGITEVPTSFKTLEHWKEQGVFLLNTGLTVEANLPGSHLKYWNNFIRATINYIAINNPCNWLLWGKQAQSFTVNMPVKSLFEVIGYDRTLIEEIPLSPYFNYIFKASHPAAECYRKGAGFLGCDHFYLSNRVLDKLGKQTINW
jgi:uracil-DNA glycosylase